MPVLGKGLQLRCVEGAVLSVLVPVLRARAASDVYILCKPCPFGACFVRAASNALCKPHPSGPCFFRALRFGTQCANRALSVPENFVQALRLPMHSVNRGARSAPAPFNSVLVLSKGLHMHCVEGSVLVPVLGVRLQTHQIHFLKLAGPFGACFVRAASAIYERRRDQGGVEFTSGDISESMTIGYNRGPKTGTKRARFTQY